MSATKSSQGSRVQQELEVLRQKQLAKSQRDKLKDCAYFVVYATNEGAASLMRLLYLTHIYLPLAPQQ